MSKNVIIVGGGMLGTVLATMLLTKGHGVKLIEMDREELLRLQRDLTGKLVVAGDGTDPDVLEASGIRAADIVAATTGEDETNLVVTSLARFAFNVKRTAARVNNPKNAWMFTPVMGVDVAISQADTMAGLILKETVTE